MPSGRPGATKEQEERIREFIREELLLGRTFEELVIKVRKRAPLIGLSTARSWINSVIEAIAITKAEAKEGVAFRLGLADQRLHDLYRRAIEMNDLKTALQIHTHWIKLHGLEAKKVARNPVNILLHNQGRAAVVSNQAAVGFLNQNEDEVDTPQDVPRLTTEELRKIANVEQPQDAEIVRGGTSEKSDTAGMGQGDAADRESDGGWRESGETGEGFDPTLG